MAESRSAKARRWARMDFTKGELLAFVGLLVADQVIDVATAGRMSAMKKKTLTRVVWPLVSRGGMAAGAVGRSLGATAGRAALGAAVPIVTNPYVAGAALGYGALQTPMGQDLLEAASERGRADRIAFEQALTDVATLPRKLKPRIKSKFNQAVKKGMAAVKASLSFGPRGQINDSKKALATVSKVVSAVKRKKKAPKSGIRRKIWAAVRRFF